MHTRVHPSRAWHAHCMYTQVLDDAELHQEAHPFSADDLATLARFLNALAFRLVWHTNDDEPTAAAHPGGGRVDGPGARALRKTMREGTLRLLALLADRDARRPFCPPDLWLVGELRYSELHRCDDGVHARMRRVHAHGRALHTRVGALRTRMHMPRAWPAAELRVARGCPQGADGREPAARAASAGDDAVGRALRASGQHLP